MRNKSSGGLRFEIIEHSYDRPVLMSVVASIPSHTQPLPSPSLTLQGLHLNHATARAEPSLTFGGSGLKALAISQGKESVFAEDRVERNEPEHPKSSQQQKQRQQIVSGTRRIGIKVANKGLKRLLSGAFAGAISRTAVAPLETIRTHLMVGSAGKSLPEVFSDIMATEGWKGLFRGNGVNVIRVAPSKAIELFAYDTMKKHLTPEPGCPPIVPFPVAPLAGATAGVCSTLVTYPLELLKTRLTIQRGVYDNLLHALVKICREEGPRELYRGLSPSLIGMVPYAAINYFSYDYFRKLYRRTNKTEHVGNLETLLIGAAAGAISSTATFPLEVARKQMQVGALSGRQVYRNLFHALASIVEQHGVGGLYRGLGASCIKLMPAAGISFMCYEACKQILINEES